MLCFPSVLGFSAVFVSQVKLFCTSLDGCFILVTSAFSFLS